MRVHARTFCLPKGGNRCEDYEDAFRLASRMEGSRLRFAIADGATESSFAREWADLLVDAYVKRRLSAKLDCSSLAAIRQRWHSLVGQGPLPWYAEEKLRAGAHATFLGLTLSENLNGATRWSAVAVGDTCLVQIHRDRPVALFPIARPSDFGNTPCLLASRPTDKQIARVRSAGPAVPGDRFYLLTDAVAAWFISSSEEGCKPWTLLDRLLDDKQRFVRWVEAERVAGRMRNDDVTVLRLGIL